MLLCHHHMRAGGNSARFFVGGWEVLQAFLSGSRFWLVNVHCLKLNWDKCSAVEG